MTIHNKLAARKGTLLDDAENPGSISARRRELRQADVAGLERWARKLADSRQESVPSFDPRSGGVNARALFLLQDPSRAASEGSGFISIDNNDQTAHNCSKAYEATGLDYKLALHWNVIPWWVHNPARKRPGRTLASEARRAHNDLLDMLDMLPHLEAVVLLGKPAQRAWDNAGGQATTVLRCPHPANQAWNNIDATTGRKNGDLTLETFAQVADLMRQNRP